MFELPDLNQGKKENLEIIFVVTDTIWRKNLKFHFFSKTGSHYVAT